MELIFQFHESFALVCLSVWELEMPKMLALKIKLAANMQSLLNPIKYQTSFDVYVPCPWSLSNDNTADLCNNREIAKTENSRRKMKRNKNNNKNHWLIHN